MRGFLWAAMHRRSLLEKTGLFDETLLIYEDYDFLLSASDFSPIISLREIVCAHPMDPSGIFSSQQGRGQNILDKIYQKRIRKIFDRAGIDGNNYLLMANILYGRRALASLDELARLFTKYHPGIESSFLAGLAGRWTGAYSASIDRMKRVAGNLQRLPPGATGQKNASALGEMSFLFLCDEYFRKRNASLSRRYLSAGLRLYPNSLALRLEHLYRHGPLHVKDKGERGRALKMFASLKESAGRGETGLLMKAVDRKKDDAPPYHFLLLAADTCERNGRSETAQEYKRSAHLLQNDLFFSALFSKQMLSLDRAYWQSEIAPRIFLEKVPSGPDIVFSPVSEAR